MATSTIQKLPRMQWSNAVLVNTNYITLADNHLETEKWGRICMLTGYFTNVVEIPTYTTVLWVPSDRMPFINFSFQPQSDWENYWLFGDTNGTVSTQGRSIPVGTHYITVFYMTTY